MAHILYLAPADASSCALASGSVDYHYSITTFEHIPLDEVANIWREAARILKPTGRAIHFIDLSDHFQHQDASISTINFLAHNEEEWNRIACNQFAYCNRCRPNDYLEVIKNLPLTIVRRENVIDYESKELVGRGFKLDDAFSSITPDELCTIQLKLMLKRDR